jgi:hypothetical protein
MFVHVTLAALLDWHGRIPQYFQLKAKWNELLVQYGWQATTL